MTELGRRYGGRLFIVAGVAMFLSACGGGGDGGVTEPTRMPMTLFAAPMGGDGASCVNSGADVCTLNRVMAMAIPGDTIEAACGIYDQAGTTLVITKNVTIAPVTDGCAIITGTNTNSIVSITASNDDNTLTFGAFEVQNTGGATNWPISINNAAYDAVVVLDGTTVSVGGTLRHISDTWTRGTIKLINVNLNGTMGSQAGFYSSVTPSAAKKVLISGGAYSLTASASNGRVIYIARGTGTTVSEWVLIQGVTIDYTVPNGLGASASGWGILLTRITSGTDLDGQLSPPVVENNTLTITGLSATASSMFGIAATSTDATTVSNNTVIRNNTLTCNFPAGYCISMNIGLSAANADNARIYGNTLTGPFYNGVATPHGINCGTVLNCQIYGNRINGFAVGAICSMSTNCLVTANVSVGAYDVPFFAKGNTSATFANNTAILDDTLYGSRISSYGCLGVAAQSGTPNVATLFQNNLCYVRNGTNWKYSVVDNAQVANFEHNNYFSDVPLTNPWSYQGSTDTTVTAWNTRSTVGTDLNVDPLLISTTDFHLQDTSTLKQAGLTWGSECTNFEGQPCLVPPNIGAY